MKYIFSVLFFIINVAIFAQNADTLGISGAVDSLVISQPDSLALNDSSKIEKKTDIDAVVFANATDSLSFDVKNKKMGLFGKSEVKYKKTELKSANIYVDFDTNNLDAFGVKDTSDSTGNKLMDTPVLSEAGEKYEGKSIKYNFKSQRGFISMAKNKADDKTYGGDKVKKVDKRTYFIEDGMFTTCDSDTPHTHFTATKMKVIQKDKIIARWVFMYIGGVPFPIPLPFGVFPNESGRRSGLIIPSWGHSGIQGWYFRKMGYYLALSDYVDAAFTGDYYLRGGFATNGRIRYKKRYDYYGNFSGGYSNTFVGEKNDLDKEKNKSWNLLLSHHQSFTPTLNLNVNLNFTKGDFYRYNSYDINKQANQSIISNATLNKNWDESGNSMTINYNRNQNLDSGEIREILPKVSFSMSRFYPFRSSTSSGKKKWYENIGVSYNGDLENHRNTIDNSLKIRGGIQHRLSSNITQKFGYFNISPGFSYNEKWYNKHITKKFEIDANGDTVLTQKDVKDIDFVRTFDFNISASTKIYGMAQPGILGISAFRHTLNPVLSYNYRPDFSDKKWGYYEEVYDPRTGKMIKYDKYGEEVFYGVSSGESQSIRFSLGNIFEMKTAKDPTDTTSKEKKVKLLNLNLSSSYNFAADSMKLSDLNVTYRTEIANLVNFSGTSRYSFYDHNGTRAINKYLINEGKGLLRLVNFNIYLSTTLSGDKITGEKRKGKRMKMRSYLIPKMISFPSMKWNLPIFRFHGVYH